MDIKYIAVLLFLACSIESVWMQSSTILTTPSSIPTTVQSTPPSSIPTTVQSTTTLPSSTTSSTEKFSCKAHTGTEIDLAAISGLWYEVARVPAADDLHCVNFVLPKTPTEDNKLVLEMEYVSSADNKWTHVKDKASVPWDDDAKNGIFTWYLDESLRLKATYKLVITDNTKYAFLCAYVDLVPAEMFTVWTRKRDLTSKDRIDLQMAFNGYGQTAELSWVEQSEGKCNAASRTAGGAIFALALALIVRFVKF